MTELTRTISISFLVFLSFFCFQAGIFLWSGHKLRQNGRRTLICIEFFTGFLLLFDALAYFYRGNTSASGWYMVRLCNFCVFACNFSISFFFCFYVCEFIQQSRLSLSLLSHPASSVKGGIPVQLFIVLLLCLAGIAAIILSQFTDLFYYFDENNLYHRSTLYPLGIVLGILPALITITMLLQNRKKLQVNAFISLLLYFVLPVIGLVLILVRYGFPWINVSLGLGALHLFYSSIKLMELEFYSGERAQGEGIEKIKTIGDAYMAASGLTLERNNDGAARHTSCEYTLLKLPATGRRWSPQWQGVPRLRRRLR